MKILAITANYPHTSSPYSGIFVKNTLAGLVKLGFEVVVIAPQKLHQPKMPYYAEEEGLQVYRPVYPTFSAKKILGFNTVYLSNKSFELAVKRTCKRINFQPGVVYSHFLIPAGNTAAKVAKKLNVKAFCAIGEDNLLNYLNVFPEQQLSKCIESIDCFIPNNFTAYELLCNRFNVPQQKARFVPSGVDTNKFKPLNKEECRRKLGLPLNEKIVISVGGFEERKGPLRVLDACRKANSKPKVVFIGQGNQEPSGDDVLFKGSVGHDELPLYLNAADVFVMPTLSEGMPNALLEAMACSCNIVASNIDVNKYVLQNYTSYKLINAMDVAALAKSIDEFLSGAISPQVNSFSFTLDKRAEEIANFLQTQGANK